MTLKDCYHWGVVGVQGFVEVVHLDGDADYEIGKADVGQAIAEVIGLACDGIHQGYAQAFYCHNTQTSH